MLYLVLNDIPEFKTSHDKIGLLMLIRLKKMTSVTRKHNKCTGSRDNDSSSKNKFEPEASMQCGRKVLYCKKSISLNFSETQIHYLTYCFFN